MRIQTPVSIHASIQQQTNIVAVSQNAIHERPSKLTEFLFTLGIPEEILSPLADGNVSMHAVSIHAYHRLGQKARSHSHARGHLAANQFIKLNLIRGRNYFAV